MNTNWISLEKIEQLDKLLLDSHHKPVFIFKHSTRCGISCEVYEKLELNFDLNGENVDFYYLDLLNFRFLSDEISSRLNVTHQSPQLILVSKGKAIFHQSHHQIGKISLKQTLTNIQV